MALALLIVAMAAVTFATRYALIALLGRWELPPAAAGWLKLIPTAVFAAIVAQGTLAPQGTLRLAWRNPYLFGALAAGLAAWRARNLLLTIAAGMGGLWLARLWLG